MSSSTSNSEPPPGQGEAPREGGNDARAALVAGAVAFVTVCLLSLAVILATDPYDRGHVNLIGDKGVPQFGQPLRNASIGRQSGFNAAIIGNSTAQLLNPANLDGIGDTRFVSLTMLGARPAEMLAMAEWFMAKRKDATQAVVFGIDQSWCQPEGALIKGRPFPYWLYGASAAGYIGGVLRLDSLRHGLYRIAMAAGLMPRMQSNGFEDYEPALGWNRETAERAVTQPRDIPAYDPATATFPAIERLRAFVMRLPPQTAALLVVLPRHHASIPAVDSREARMEKACHVRLAAVTSSRPSAYFITQLRDDDRARDIEKWWDYTHYRGVVAREIEGEIARVLAARSIR